MARLRDLVNMRHWTNPEYFFQDAYGFPAKPWQEPYLWETRPTIVLKGRQVGASTCGGALADRFGIIYPGSLSAIVSPSLKQSKEVKQRAHGALLKLGVKMVRDSDSLIELENGSRIMSMPGSAKSVRGWSADFLIIDEAAFIDPETFLAARATVAATGGRIIVQSTPAGPFGHFYDLWNSGEEGWARYSISSEAAGTITPEFLAAERATMTEDEYAQEYLGVFSAPGLGLVDPERLRALTHEAGAADESAAQSIWDRLRGAQ